MKGFLLLLVVCISSLFFLAYRITDVPPGINGDEASIGYNAVLISKTLHDESGRFLPLFINTNSTDWRQPIYVYTMAGLFKIFGLSYLLLRGTSVFFIIVSLIILYILSKEYFNTRFFILAWIIFITSPIVILLSHWGAENIASVPFILLWLLFMAKFEKSNKKIYMFFGGMTLGVGLFTYYGARAFIPVLVLLTLFYLFLIFKTNFKKIILMFSLFLIGTVPFFIILYLSKFYYPGAIFGYHRSLFPSIYDFFFRYLSTFDMSFLFFRGDSTVYHSTGKFGMFLLASLPLFIVGVRKILISGKPFEKLILLAFFISPILFGFVFDVYRASRLLSLVPFYILISAIGLSMIPKKLGIIAIIMVVFNYAFFINDYWFNYPERVKSQFSTPINIAFRVASEEISKNDAPFYIEGGIQTKESLAVRFFKEIYFPNKTLNILEINNIPNNSLIMANPDIINGINRLQLKELTPLLGFYKLYIKKI